MIGRCAYLVRAGGRLGLLLGLLSLAVLTPVSANQGVYPELALHAPRGFDGNGLDDLAVGVPFEDVNAPSTAPAPSTCCAARRPTA